MFDHKRDLVMKSFWPVFVIELSDITGTGIGMLLFLCCRGWLDKVLVIILVAIGSYCVFTL